MKEDRSLAVAWLEAPQTRHQVTAQYAEAELPRPYSRAHHAWIEDWEDEPECLQEVDDWIAGVPDTYLWNRNYADHDGCMNSPFIQRFNGTTSFAREEPIDPIYSDEYRGLKDTRGGHYAR